MSRSPVVSSPVVSGPVVSGPVVRNRPRRLRSVVLWSCGLVVLLAAFCFVFRSPLLTGLARAWIVNESPAQADAIVVPGGGIYTRPFEAARLYSQGYAKEIWIMNVMPTPLDNLDFVLPETKMTRLILLRKGVPEQAVRVLDRSVSNTRDEALAVAEQVAKTGARRILVSTDLFHTRRVRWIFRKTLKPTGAQVLVEAHDAPGYSASNWWCCEQGLIAFQNEVVKFAYYLVKY